MPPAVTTYAAWLADELRTRLGGAFTALYVHGSAAMGGWDARLSDVDLLAVVTRELTPLEKRGLAELLHSPANPAPGTGLEMSVVTAASLSTVPARPPFELHVTTGSDSKAVDGSGHPGDPDLLMHFAVCRARGIAIVGPEPALVLPRVPRPLLAQALKSEVQWGLEHAPPRYAVLNACRAWAFADGTGMLSKLEGGAWALQRGIEPELVRAALAAQAGGNERVDRPATERVVARAIAALNSLTGTL